MRDGRARREISDPLTPKCLNGTLNPENTAPDVQANWTSNPIAFPGRDSCDVDQTNALLRDANAKISSQCLFHVDIPNGPTGNQARTAYKRLLQEVTGVPCNFSCSFVLVGVHAMTFVDSPKDQLPHWLWATFWWTPNVNGRPGLTGPWAHFQMKVTSQGIGPASNTIVYNPYLEGTRDPHGRVSNCIQCHQFASYIVDRGPDGASVLNGGIAFSVNKSSPRQYRSAGASVMANSAPLPR